MLGNFTACAEMTQFIWMFSTSSRLRADGSDVAGDAIHPAWHGWLVVHPFREFQIKYEVYSGSLEPVFFRSRLGTYRWHVETDVI